MKIKLFIKRGKICYSTANTDKDDYSLHEKELLHLGWKYSGNFYGYDISSNSIKSMSVVLKQEREK